MIWPIADVYPATSLLDPRVTAILEWRKQRRVSERQVKGSEGEKDEHISEVGGVGKDGSS